MAGIWFFYFVTGEPDKFMGFLSTAAGLVVNVISGWFLFYYSKTQGVQLHYYEQLSSLKKISLAMLLVDEHPDPEKQLKLEIL